MIPKVLLPELRGLRALEEEFHLTTEPEWGPLVVPTGNAEEAVHRWFKYKESYSHLLLSEILSVIDAPKKQKVTVLDPFCGVGTTLVAAQRLSTSGYNLVPIGIECNPFSHFAARTKTTWNGMSSTVIRKLGAQALLKSRESSKLPSLSSISQGRCITKHTARRIVSIADRIRALGASADSDAVLLALAATIEPLSKVRRDGRALRIVRKHRQNTDRLFSEHLEYVATDVADLRTDTEINPATIHLGDGRRPLDSGVPAGSVDLVVTSPPYPNNIDYNEIYKLELWLLGLVSNAEDFLQLRKGTFRSHPTCSSIEEDSILNQVLGNDHLKTIISPVLEKIERFPGKFRRRVFLGYCHDLWVSLSQQAKCLKSGGHAVWVVGNSLHGGEDSPYLIPTDLLVAAFAHHCGLIVEKIAVARALKRRLTGNHFLRDSIVFLRKQ